MSIKKINNNNNNNNKPENERTCVHTCKNASNAYAPWKPLTQTCGFYFLCPLSIHHFSPPNYKKFNRSWFYPIEKEKKREHFFHISLQVGKLCIVNNRLLPKISITFELCLLYFFLYKDNYLPNSKLYLASFCILTQVNELTNIVF